MKIGQPKLSERKSQRSGLSVTPAMSEDDVMSEIEDYGLEWRITFKAKRNQEIDCPSIPIYCISNIFLLVGGASEREWHWGFV